MTKRQIVFHSVCMLFAFCGFVSGFCLIGYALDLINVAEELYGFDSVYESAVAGSLIIIGFWFSSACFRFCADDALKLIDNFRLYKGDE